MEIEMIAILSFIAFVIIYILICNISEILASKKTKVAEIYIAGSEREILAQIRRDCKKNNWEIYDITLLEKSDNYIKVIAILEER